MADRVQEPVSRTRPVGAEELRARYDKERAKRLRADGTAQYRGADGELSHLAEDPFEPVGPRAPLHTEVEFLLIGGGFASLTAAVHLRRAGIEDIRIVDRAGGFGGTWYWNRYPGAMCDIDASIYLPFLEETGHRPRHRYAFGPDIRAHAEALARTHGLADGALFSTTVTGARWDDGEGRWWVTTDRGDLLRARFVSMAIGPLDRPKLPRIPGLGDFAGHVFHTSRWDYGYTGGDEHGGLTGLRDKRVAVIGTGATGVQCVPQLGEWAGHLYVVQRTPAAVDVRDNRPTGPDEFRGLPAGWQAERVRNFTTVVSGSTEETDLVHDGWTAIFRELTAVAAGRAEEDRGGPLTRAERHDLMTAADFATMDRIRDRIDRIVADPATAEALKPWYDRWCKRPCFHDDYYPTFNRPDVTLVDTDGRGVDRITEHGFVVAGEHYDVDCLILATGFEVGTEHTHRAGFDVEGRDGAVLSEKWANGYRTLHGLHTAGFPNLFFLGVTQTGVSPNYSHTVAEQAAHLGYIVRWMREHERPVVEATPEAEEDYVAEIERHARQGTWYYERCTPSYFTNEGDLTDPRKVLAGAYGKGPLAFFALLDRWRRRGDLAGLAFPAGEDR
ncbi:flavin-containing monooxygenase [Pseudonocardia pini]|uniref:flavin-containing monooxygenase n=1 Tax=Pseudonocardia pini TaxID=2758030 RepID=UPI0028A7581B|nr:NAD(P)/FAD-dependent oxidoreductase [Pseudonocardia pini]